MVIRQGDTDITVTFKKVRALRIVITADGNARVSAPADMPPEQVRRFLEEKAGWLKKHLERKRNRTVTGHTLTDFSFEYGDSLLLLGRLKTLKCSQTPGKPFVKETENELILASPTELSARNRKLLLFTHLTDRLKMETDRLLNKWLRQMQEPDLREVVLRLMKSQWGNCYPDRRRITLNIKLIHYPLPLIESVVVHELCHLRERSHNARFYRMCTSCLPDYREREKTLKSGCFPLQCL